MKRMQAILVGLLLCSMSTTQTAMNQLKKLYHNRVAKGETPSIELGTLVFYFDREPKIEEKESQKKEKSITKKLFLPAVELSPEVDAMVQALNRVYDAPYAVHVNAVSAPVKGVEITIRYDASKVGISYDTYETISMSKGIVLRFFNQEIINRLDLAKSPIIQTARNTVVIDCGHGGEDCGAVGCYNIKEKDVSLPIGLEVAQLLRDKGITVQLARDADCTVALDTRTSFANGNDADLFVSIHANSAKSKETAGVETYCVAPGLFCPVFRDSVAWNCVEKKDTKSNRLAHCVHNAVIHTLRTVRKDIVDRHVRHAVPQVLVGTTMPAILIEIGFLTNAQEAMLLASRSYQKQVARGISRGILTYLQV